MADDWGIGISYDYPKGLSSDERASRYAKLQNAKAKKRHWERQFFQHQKTAAQDPDYWESNFPGGKEGWLAQYGEAINQADADIASIKNPQGGKGWGFPAVANAGEMTEAAQQQAATRQTQQAAAAQQTAGQAAAQPAEPQPATGFTTEARQVGGVEANVTLNPNNRVVKVTSGDKNAPGPYGMVELVDPNAAARGVPSPEQVAQYQRQQAAMQRYGNIMRPNGESDRDFNLNSRVLITPREGQRATKNRGYTFDGSAGDALAFFQDVPHGGGYNPYKKRFRTLFDDQMDARAAAKQAPAASPLDGYNPRGWQGQRAKAQMAADMYKTDLQAAQSINTAAMQDARARDQFGLQFAQTMGQMGTQDLQNAQLRQQIAQNAQVNAINQKLASARPGSQEWLAAYKTKQALEGKYAEEQQPEFGFDKIKRDNGDGTSSEQMVVTNKRTGAVTPVQMDGGQGGGGLFEGDQFARLLDSPAGKRALEGGKDTLLALIREVQKENEAAQQGRR